MVLTFADVQIFRHRHFGGIAAAECALRSWKDGRFGCIVVVCGVGVSARSSEKGRR